jgi:hypothetical protein
MYGDAWEVKAISGEEEPPRVTSRGIRMALPQTSWRRTQCGMVSLGLLSRVVGTPVDTWLCVPLVQGLEHHLKSKIFRNAQILRLAFIPRDEPVTVSMIYASTSNSAEQRLLQSLRTSDHVYV